MKEQDIHDLCIKLMIADKEEDVISCLDEYDLWYNSHVWRLYGDRENNYSTIGNQQSRPDAALVEKLVNSIDARLLNECLATGINPESEAAPRSIRKAVARYFEDGSDEENDYSGKISNWDNNKRTGEARYITLAATGFSATEGKPSFTIADNGEGQTPEMMPFTFLSLDKSNKLRIPFVQGKFNMGGTGVLRFCGRHNLQLILSRRNPKLPNKNNSAINKKWGFTIVKRNNPEEGRRNSVYKYLAPINANNRHGKGDVLNFMAKTMPIFPDGRNAYGRDSQWGSLIKLYEYDIAGYRSHILRKDGILGRLELLMPEAALPIRLYECRSGYRGHAGSFENTLNGLGVRLEDGKSENIEEGFPVSAHMVVMGEQITAKIFVFKKGRADAYRKSEGIIFILNGQTHAHLTTDFFRRKNVGLSYLADSLLVTLDCSLFSGRSIEDLFINSRDRLSKGELHDEILKSLEILLKEHEGLRSLKEKRRREEIESRLEDSKPLEDVLENLLKNSPVLSQLFLLGQRITSPFKSTNVQSDEIPYKGNNFPTYFRFKGKDYGHVLLRQAPKNRRCRIVFETDAVNDYFERESNRGEFSLTRIVNGGEMIVENYIRNLLNGHAVLTLRLPEDCALGDILQYNTIVNDISRIEPFQNKFTLTIVKPAENGGGEPKPRKPPTKKEGNDNRIPSGIQLPHIIEVYESPDSGKKTWSQMDPAFDKYSALRIRYAGPDENSTNGKQNSADVYDFYVNVDNAYARMELKAGKAEPELTRARFVYGMVLVGLGLLQQRMQDHKKGDNAKGDLEEESEDNIENKVEEFSRAIAPILLPMIDGLGALDLEAAEKTTASGEIE